MQLQANPNRPVHNLSTLERWKPKWSSLWWFVIYSDG